VVQMHSRDKAVDRRVMSLHKAALYSTVQYDLSWQAQVSVSFRFAHKHKQSRPVAMQLLKESVHASYSQTPCCNT
jgi:hypothetical protein